jgi:hypothetical protein
MNSVYYLSVVSITLSLIGIILALRSTGWSQKDLDRLEIALEYTRTGAILGASSLLVVFGLIAASLSGNT